MKKFSSVALSVLIVIMAFVVSGCETLVAPPETTEPVSSNINGKILIKASLSSGQKLTSSNGQIEVPYNTAVVFEAETADTTIKIAGWQWGFPDGQAAGKYAVYTIKDPPGNTLSIRLTGISASNVSYQALVTVVVAWNINGNDLVINLSTTMEANNSCTVVFALSTERLKKQASGNYFVKGTINQWNRDNISGNDTAYSIVGGVLVPDSKGFYLKLTVNQELGDQQFGLGKMIGSNEIWEDFKGSPYVDSTNWTLLKYNLSVSGGKVILTPKGSGLPPIITPIAEPGLVGDQGEKWVVRLTPNSNDSLGIFINHFIQFSTIHPFVSFRDADGRYIRNVAESAVTGFNTAGRISIHASDTLIAFKFGTNIYQPTTYSDSTMRLSGFYNSEFGDIRFVLITVPTTPTSVSSVSRVSQALKFKIRPAVKGTDY